MNNLSNPDLTDEAMAQKERVAESVNGVADRASQQRERAIERAINIADNVRTQVGSVPGNEKAAEAVQSATERVKKGAEYVRGRDPAEMGSSLVSTVKRHPVATAAVALAAFLTFGFLFRSSSRSDTTEQ